MTYERRLGEQGKNATSWPGTNHTRLFPAQKPPVRRLGANLRQSRDVDQVGEEVMRPEKNAKYAHCEIEKDCRSGGTHDPSPSPSPYLTLVGLGLGYPCGRGGKPREKALSTEHFVSVRPTSLHYQPSRLVRGGEAIPDRLSGTGCNGWHCNAKTWGRLSYCAALRSPAGVIKIPNPCQAWGVGCSNYGSMKSALLCNDEISCTSQLSDATASSIVVARCLLHPIWDERAFFVATIGQTRQIIPVFYRHA